MESSRQGISKLLNSLSWNSKVVPPHAIGTSKTLLRIDLRDYKWSKSTWNLLAAGYPYTVLRKNEEEKRSEDATQTDRFVLRGDWFAAQATSPTLYSRLLQLPASAADLKRLLGVRDLEKVEGGDVHRAGFLGSPVTSSARLIERHESNFGSLWIAYTGTSKEGLFESPLSMPGSRDLPVSSSRLAMFHLPNGLLGFAIWDDLQRMQELVEGVHDARLPRPQVHLAISCLSCHAGGIIPKEDQVYSHASKAGDKKTLAKLRPLFPPRDEFLALVELDNKRFHAAVGRTGSSSGSVDPVVALAVRHEEDIPLNMLAAELDLDPADFNKKKTSGRLASLLRTAKSDRVPRMQFIRAFPDLAPEVGLGGTPARVELPPPPVHANLLLAPRPLAKLPDVAKKALIAPLRFRPEVSPSTLRNPLQAMVEDDYLVYQYLAYRSQTGVFAMTPDGKTLAMEKEAGRVTLFDPITLEEKLELEAHDKQLTAMAFSRDGKLLVTAGMDRSVKVWRASSGLLLFTLPQAAAVAQIKFSPDGKTFATLSNAVNVWNLGTGKRVDGPKTTEPIKQIEFADNGQTLVLLGRSLHYWKVGTRVVRKVLEFKSSPCRLFAVSPDSKVLITADLGNKLTLWDANTLEPKGNLGTHSAVISALAFTPDSKMLISVTGILTGGSLKPGVCKAWEISSQTPVQAWQVNQTGILSVAVNERTIAAHGRDGLLRLWNLNKEERLALRVALPPQPFEGHFGDILHLDASADGTTVLTGGADGTVRVWDGRTGKARHVLRGHRGDIIAVALSSDGKSAFSCGKDQTLRTWDLDRGSEVENLDLKLKVHRAVFARDRKTFAVATWDRGVCLFNLELGRMICEVGSYRRGVPGLALSSDGKKLAVASRDGGIQIWDTQRPTAAPTNIHYEAANQVNTMAFSPDGQLLAACSMDGLLALYDVDNGRKTHQLGEFPGFSQGLAFCPKDGSLFVSSGRIGFQPSQKIRVALDCSVACVNTTTGRATCYWDQFPFVPRHLVVVDGGRQVYATTGATLSKLTLVNAKAVAEK